MSFLKQESDYKYTFVQLVEDSTQFQEFLSFSDDIYLDSKVQFIVIDRSNQEDEAGLIQQSASANHMEYHRVSSQLSVGEAYNLSFSWIFGTYVCFTNANIYYDEDVIKGIDEAFYALPFHKIAMLDYANYQDGFSYGNPKLPVKFILDKEESVFLFLYSYFFSYDLIRNQRFISDSDEETAVVFLMNTLKTVKSITYAKGYYARYNRLSFSPLMYYGCNRKSFYNESLENIFLPLLEHTKQDLGSIPVWMQKSIIHTLFFKISSNYNRRDLTLLTEEEIQGLFQDIAQILQYIDDGVLIRRTHYRKFFVPLPVITFLVYLKYDGDPEKINRKFYIKNDTLYYSQADRAISLKKEQKVVLQAFNITADTLEIDAYFHTDMLYQYAPSCLYAELNGKRIEITRTEIYAYEKCFGISIGRWFTFHLTILYKDFLEDGSSLIFCIELTGKKITLPVSFPTPASRLDENCRNAYWQFHKDFILMYSEPALVVHETNPNDLRQRESNLLEERLFKEEDPAARKDYKRLRKAYFQTRGLLGKWKIWLYFDKLYKAGDNGEYQFRYDIARSKETHRKCYYIINKDSPNYRALKREFGSHILEYGSFRCRLFALHAEVIVATSPEIIQTVGFAADELLYRDLFQAKLVCISHGVTIQKNAEYQNRLVDNTMFYTTSSRYEADHICSPVYGYDRSQVAITGMARFDGLKNRDKKIILISPTWRKNLASKLENRRIRKHNESFKQSDYYRIYNDLINDQALISAAKAAGYRIVFLVHTGMTAQAEDYRSNGYVEVLKAGIDIEYEQILREASLMVTDYSGIQYDFAYMKKPIIYYQPAELPPAFKEGGLKYETMGFGPIFHDQDTLVRVLGQYLSDYCKMHQMYADRVNDFFTYSDLKNCERIHNAINDWLAATSVRETNGNC